MTLGRINIVLAVLLVLVGATGMWLDTDTDRPHYEVLPDMKYSPAYGPYSPNPNFVDRQTLQTPVPGTIARDETALHYAATPEDALRAGEEIKNPTEEEDATESVNRGAQIYRRFCVACHGAGGLGDGPVAKRGFPPPPSLLTGKSVKMKDGQLFHLLTYGQGSMPPMAAQLTLQERWDAINYVRQLQQVDAADTEPPAKTEDGEETKDGTAKKPDTDAETSEPDEQP